MPVNLEPVEVALLVLDFLKDNKYESSAAAFEQEAVALLATPYEFAVSFR
jgi:hypothetical protein